MIKIHWSFYVLIPLVALVSGLEGLVVLGFAFGSVLLHEFGHIWAAKQYGIQCHYILVTGLGCMAVLEEIPKDPKKELFITCAGPAVNVLLATVFCWYPLMLGVNIILFVFNLLPAFPMDGGRVLRALLAMKMSHSKATVITTYVAQVMAVIFVTVSLWFFAPMLCLVGVFVFVSAISTRRQETLV